jgi:hypothetical protein
MRKIKSFKLFESKFDFSDKSFRIEKVRQNLEDIFVELSDINYSVKVNALQYDITPNIHYEIILVRNAGIDFDELSDYVMMLKDYLSDYEYDNMKFHSWSFGHSDYKVDLDFDEIDVLEPRSLVVGIKISLFIKI